jgi:3'(2'), 5'-bisphosphate nucleotidase
MTDLTPILLAVRQAADLCRRVQQQHIVRSEKTGKEPVTIADYGSQAILCRAIHDAFPGDAILAEEQGSQFMQLVPDEQRAQVVGLVSEALGQPVTEAEVVRWLDNGHDIQAERTWVIDPIDGTKGFIALRRYSICVGMLVNGQVVGGVIGSPGYPRSDGKEGLLFQAQNGDAYVEPLEGGTPRWIQASDLTDARMIRVVESVERDHANLELMARVREAAGLAQAQVESLDSQDKYAMVACGDADLYLRLPREATPRHKAWDHAAGTALVLAGGGMVTDIDGSPLDFSVGPILVKNKGMIVSNGRIHERVLKAVQETLSTE